MITKFLNKAMQTNRGYYPEHLNPNKSLLISGSLVDWIDELIPLLTLVIRLYTDTEVRIERIREREEFGVRIDTGGDMYDIHIEFIEWTRKYDTGSVQMRSKAKHDQWQNLLRCKQIVLDRAGDLENNK